MAADHRTNKGRIALVGSLLIVGLLSTGCQSSAQRDNAQGVQLYQQGQFNAAMQSFQQAITAQPQSPDGYYNLASVTHRVGVQRKDPQMLAQAEQLYNQSLDLNPNQADCYRGLAVLLVETNRQDKAFTLINGWAQRQPASAEPRIELARLYEEFGQRQQAQLALEDAIQKDPNNPRAWLALGQAREKSGDLQQALANYQRSYMLNPQQPMVEQRIASINQQLSLSAPTMNPAPLSAGGTQVVQTPTQPPRY
jgi:Tfp pilus assembly protein PilF